MEDTLDIFRKAALAIEKTGDERGYRGAVVGVPEISVEFLSASEIARHLQSGRIHVGVTGEDLVREQMPDADERVAFLLKLGFGHANVITAVPDCWLDVQTMADLEEAGALFAAEHSRRLRVATKYPMLTRRFFAAKGVAHYRTVESLGATEGAPAAGMAEAIVDITSTGATLKANGLRILSDGLILQSEANLVASQAAAQGAETAILCATVAEKLGAALRTAGDAG
jgi:ATP phosphoribosyltransferase